MKNHHKYVLIFLNLDGGMGQGCPIKCTPFFVWTENTVLQWALNVYSSLAEAETWPFNGHSMKVTLQTLIHKIWTYNVIMKGQCWSHTPLYGYDLPVQYPIPVYKISESSGRWHHVGRCRDAPSQTLGQAGIWGLLAATRPLSALARCMLIRHVEPQWGMTHQGWVQQLLHHTSCNRTRQSDKQKCCQLPIQPFPSPFKTFIYAADNQIFPRILNLNSI